MRYVCWQLELSALVVFLFGTGAYGISPVGTNSNNQDYFDLANDTDDFLSVGLVSVPGGACSGTWLGDDIVLTARHCGGSDESITFTFPDGTAIGSVGHWPSALAENNNDLAIVKLAETPDLPANYLPAKIRLNNDGIVGQLATLVGYGGIGRSAGQNNIAYGATIGEVGAIRSNATTLPLGANLFAGDSGGPLFIEESDGSYSVIGVASAFVGDFDVWANPVAHLEQIEFGMTTGNFLFFQEGAPIPDLLADLTLDDVINDADIQAFVSGWLGDHTGLTAEQAWQRGDINGDRTTDLLDWQVLRREYPTMASAISARLSQVPEPSSAISLLLGFACFASMVYGKSNSVR